MATWQIILLQFERIGQLRFARHYRLHIERDGETANDLLGSFERCGNGYDLIVQSTRVQFENQFASRGSACHLLEESQVSALPVGRKPTQRIHEDVHSQGNCRGRTRTHAVLPQRKSRMPVLFFRI